MAPKKPPRDKKDPYDKMQRKLGGHLSKDDLRKLSLDRGDTIRGRKLRRGDQDGSPR